MKTVRSIEKNSPPGGRFEAPGISRREALDPSGGVGIEPQMPGFDLLRDRFESRDQSTLELWNFAAKVTLEVPVT